MCIACPEHERHGHGSITDSARGALVTVAMLATVALTFKAMIYTWPILLTAWCVGMAWVYAPRPTRAVLRALRRTVAWAWRRWVRRPAPPAAWQATVALTGPDGEVRSLTRSVPAGALAATTAADAAEEIRARLLAEHGAQQAISCRVDGTESRETRTGDEAS